MKFDKYPPTYITNRMIWAREDQFEKLMANGYLKPATQADVDGIFHGSKICMDPATEELYTVDYRRWGKGE